MSVFIEQDCCVFYKTREQWGQFSNMAHGFPLVLEGKTIYSSEALYQAAKFDPISSPEVVNEIMFEPNSMASKMKAKKYKSIVLPNWDEIKVDVMVAVVTIKYLQHKTFFDDLLDQTGNRIIVEKSRRDRLWGAVPDGQGNLVGDNLLGEIWMNIRNDRPNDLEPDRGTGTMATDDMLNS